MEDDNFILLLQSFYDTNYNYLFDKLNLELYESK